MMSIPDELMWSYYELVTDRTPEEISEVEKQRGRRNHASHGREDAAGAAKSSPDFTERPPRVKASETFQHVFRDRKDAGRSRR